MEVVERRILSKISQVGESATMKDIQRDLRDVEPKILVEAMRSLVASRKVSISQVDGERVISMANNLAEGLAVVFDLIRSSGCEGIDQVTICAKAKLPKTEVTKALTQLQNQQRIKDIRCFSNKAKKLYMLAELEPSEAVTGGAFYNEQRDIDVPFVDDLRGRIVAFVTSMTSASMSQIAQMIQLNMTGKTLNGKELSQLLATLEMDGVLECISQGPRSSHIFRLGRGGSVTRHSAPTAIGSMTAQFPCVGCPMLDRCASHGVGVVNPASCVYLDDWLRLS